MVPGCDLQRYLPLTRFVLDRLGLLLGGLGSPWRSERWRKADEAKEDQNWKQSVEKRLLPVQVHGRPELGTLRTNSRGLVGRQIAVAGRLTCWFGARWGVVVAVQFTPQGADSAGIPRLFFSDA